MSWLASIISWAPATRWYDLVVHWPAIGSAGANPSWCGFIALRLAGMFAGVWIAE
jgi:hypothetical protein